MQRGSKKKKNNYNKIYDGKGIKIKKNENGERNV